MAGSTHSPFSSAAASQPAFAYIQGVSVATDSTFPASPNFSTGLQLPCPPVSLDMIDEYQLQHGFFDQLGPDSSSLLSFQPSFSYVAHLPDGSDMSGLTSPDFLGLQDDMQIRSGSYSPETLNPQTPPPSLRSRRRTSHVAPLQHSPSPSYMPSPYLTSPAATSMTSPQQSLHPTLVHRSGRSSAIPSADDDGQAASSHRKKRRSHPPAPSSPSSSSPPGLSSSSSSSATAAAAARDIDRERLSAADALLVHLREDEGMAWRDVAARFRAETGRDFSVAALQMRLKRLRERARPWTERDVAALRRAHDYWISHKFDIIAAKMIDFGVAEGWTGRQCARKLQQMGFPTSPIEEK